MVRAQKCPKSLHFLLAPSGTMIHLRKLKIPSFTESKDSSVYALVAYFDKFLATLATLATLAGVKPGSSKMDR